MHMIIMRIRYCGIPQARFILCSLCSGPTKHRTGPLRTPHRTPQDPTGPRQAPKQSFGSEIRHALSFTHFSKKKIKISLKNFQKIFFLFPFFQNISRNIETSKNVKNFKKCRNVSIFKNYTCRDDGVFSEVKGVQGVHSILRCHSDSDAWHTYVMAPTLLHAKITQFCMQNFNYIDCIFIFEIF